MGDLRPAHTVDPTDHQPAAPLPDPMVQPNGDVSHRPSPPFVSSPVQLDDGRAVGLTEPSPISSAVEPPMPAVGLHARWSTAPAVLLLRSAWGGIGIWAGAASVAALAVVVFGQMLTGLAVEQRAPETGAASEALLAGGLDDDSGFGLSDGQRGSRARTTGELVEDGRGGSGSGVAGTGRSSGSSDGLDLDAGHRSAEQPGAVTVPSADGTTGRSGDLTTIDARSAGSERSGESASVATTATTVGAATNPVAGELPASASSETPPATPGNAVDRGDDHSDADADQPEPSNPESGPPGPAPETPPEIPPSTRPPDRQPPVTGPVTPPTTPPVADDRSRPPGPPSSGQPPTTRRPVPADTRPSRGRGNGRGSGSSSDEDDSNGANADSGSNGRNGSNGRAVGRRR